MNKLFSYTCAIIIGLSLFLGCYSGKTVNNYDYTYLYDESQKLIKPSFKVYHHHKDSSTIYYQLSSNNILYGRLGDSLLKARIWVKYKLYLNNERKQIIDSATLKLVNYGHNDNAKILQGELRIMTPIDGRYPLEVRFRDENKDLNVIYQITVDKRINNNEQYFLLKEGQKVSMDPITTHSKNIYLHKSPLVSINSFIQEGSNYEYSMASPPFAENAPNNFEFELNSKKEQVFTADSLLLKTDYVINRLSLNHNDSLYPFFFYQFYDGYPKIVDIDQMIHPIRYISTTSEYKKVIHAINPKKAIDNFWLKLARNQDRAKKLIKQYYNRIEEANTYFTSYKEGWKTDRGIVYTVYGTPTTVYKDGKKETWIYGEENNILSVRFIFTKVDNPMSDNDYNLKRNPDYKNNWYRAVDLWRQAKVF